MKTAKISQVQDLAVGQIIGEMTFKIKKAFPARTGEGQYGAWSVQNAIVTDDTGEIKCSFWADGSEPLGGLEGHTVQVKSVAGKRGLSGISVKENPKTKEIELDVKAAASIRSLNADSGASIPMTHTPATVASPQAARKRIFQSAQLYLECCKAAEYIKTQAELSDEHFQAAVASLFISADRAGLAQHFPDSTAKPAEKPAAPASDDDDIPMGDDEFKKETGW